MHTVTQWMRRPLGILGPQLEALFSKWGLEEAVILMQLALCTWVRIRPMQDQRDSFAINGTLGVTGVSI